MDLPVAREHLDELRVSVGVAQFAVGREPDLRLGYCTDDVARALVVDVRHAALFEDGAERRSIEAAIHQDLAFLDAALDAGTGRFRNFRAQDGRWTERIGSEDAHGRAVQALGEVATRSQDPAVRSIARRLLARSLPAVSAFAWCRPMAYAALGCAAALDDEASAPAARASLVALVDRLERAVRRAADSNRDWPWPEVAVTYDNGVIAEALVTGGRRLARSATVDLGLRVLDWLIAGSRSPAGHLRPIGNRGWWPRGGTPARWDQQPIEAASLASASVAAYLVTEDPTWRATADWARDWFLGGNDLGVALAEPERGACRDGLGPSGANQNEGAESTLAWLQTVERLRDVAQATGVVRT